MQHALDIRQTIILTLTVFDADTEGDTFTSSERRNTGALKTLSLLYARRQNPSLMSKNLFDWTILAFTSNLKIHVPPTVPVGPINAELVLPMPNAGSLLNKTKELPGVVIQKQDIIGVTKTWLHDGIRDDDV